jgi:hypothetical protein
MGGASTSISSLIPVSRRTKAGTGCPGSTSVWKVPSVSPQRILMAPISVMRSWAAEPPVVSRSTAQKVVSQSGVPKSVGAPGPGIRA